MIEFAGRKFYRDSQSGYYKTLMREPNRVYLHRLIYSSEYGNIPHGWEVHHMDENRDNNTIENLRAMPKRDHNRMHRAQLRINGLRMKGNLLWRAELKYLK